MRTAMTAVAALCVLAGCATQTESPTSSTDLPRPAGTDVTVTDCRILTKRLPAIPGAPAQSVGSTDAVVTVTNHGTDTASYTGVVAVEDTGGHLVGQAGFSALNVTPGTSMKASATGFAKPDPGEITCRVTTANRTPVG